MRKPELNDEIVAILLTRIRLSISGAFTMQEIWEGWGMSKSTLYRYKSPKHRELSRESVKKNNSVRLGFNGMCAKCPEPLKGHRRCLQCTILLHSHATACRCGEKHGETQDGLMCTSCIDTIAKRILSPYQELYG